MKKIITPFLCAWVALVERHDRLVLLLLTIVAAVATVFALQNFAIDSDLDKLVRPSEKNQWHLDNQDYVRSFPDYHKNAVVVVSGESAQETFLAAETVYQALIASQHFDDVFGPVFDDFFMDRALYALPSEGVRRMASQVEESIPDLGALYHQPDIVRLLDYLQQQYSEAKDLEILLPETDRQFEAFSQSINDLLHDRQAVFRLLQAVAPDEDTDTYYYLITVKRAPAFTEKLPNQAMMNDLYAVVDSLAVDDGIQVRVTGEIAMMNEEIAAGIAGVEFAGMLSLILLAIVLGVGLRSKTVISGIFIMLFIGIMVSIVFTLLVFGHFNTLSLVFVVMFFGLGVDFAVHYTLRILELMRTEPQKPAVITATSDAGVALGICTLTSALAFLSFLPTSYIGLAELGVISAFGILMAYFLSLTFIPAWFSVLNFELSEKHKRRPVRNISLHMFPARTVLVVSLILALAASWYIRDLQFNYNLLSMRDQDAESVRTLKELQDNNIVTNYGIAALLEPDQDFAALKQQLLALDSVADVLLPQDTLPMFQEQKQQYMLPVKRQLQALGEPGDMQPLDKSLTGQRIREFVREIAQTPQDVFISDDARRVADLKSSLEQLLANPQLWPPFQQSIATGIVKDVEQLIRWFSAEPYTLYDLPEDVKKRFIDEQGRYLVHIMPALDMSKDENSSQFVTEVRSVTPHAGGMLVHEWGVGQVVMESFRQAATLAASFIFVVLVLTFRRFSTALLVFVPLILVTVYTLAVAKMLGVTLNMANVLVIPLIFGLGVDACIHVVHRYHLSESLRQLLYSSTTKAVLISALTTIGAFVSISFSPHYGAASIGILLAIALSLMLVIIFVVLPALLLMFEPKNIKLEGDTL